MYICIYMYVYIYIYIYILFDDYLGLRKSWARTGGRPELAAPPGRWGGGHRLDFEFCPEGFVGAPYLGPPSL